MSRQIDFDKPLSKEDKEWLHSMSLDYRIEENERRFNKDYQKSTGPEVEYNELNRPAAPRPPHQFPDEKVATGPVYPVANPPHQVQPYTQVGEGEEDVEYVDPEDLTVEELQDELRRLDQPVSGNKKELVKRLNKALEEK